MFFRAILDAFTGGVAHELAQAYKAHEQAKTDVTRIAAEERIKKLQAIEALQRAEAGNPTNAVIRGLIALGPVVYLLKLFIWDKVLGWGVTDDLSPELWQVLWMVLGFYVLHDTATDVTRIMRTRK